MRFASLRDFRLRASDILNQARGEESVIVTVRGKPVAVLVPVTESMVEDILRAVKGARLKAAVERARLEAKRSGKGRPSQREIDAEIARVRASRRA